MKSFAYEKNERKNIVQVSATSSLASLMHTEKGSEM